MERFGRVAFLFGFFNGLRLNIEIIVVHLDQFVTFRPFCEFIVNLYSGKYLRHRQWPLKKSDAKYLAEKRLFIFETSAKYLASEFGGFIAQVTLVLFEGAPVYLRWRCHGV